MYLSNVKLWNFRKYGDEGEINLSQPNLDLNFTKGLNVLIGENDSGKTAVIDAIKLVLKTHSYDWIRVSLDDFFIGKEHFRIELRFDDLNHDEAKNFTEWLGWEGEGTEAIPFLRVIYDVSRNIADNYIIPSDVRAGVDESGYQLTAEAREYLKTTYLKPLRDAQSELVPRKNSRLAQILLGHEALPVIEIETNNAFYDYDAKYISGETIYHCPADLSNSDRETIQALSMRAFKSIGCEVWGRVDLMRDYNGDFFVLEVNTVPGMTANSLVPKSA